MGKIYAEVLEESALEQFNSAMEQSFVVDGALMPDAHTGYSLPIGAVVKTKGVILPAWVGYDIGCGMCALKLDHIKREQIESNSDEIFKLIYEKIPVGFNVNKTSVEHSLEGLTVKGKEIAKKKNYQSAIGSLGGGNHFIEIGYDEDETVWIIIHSGSRGVGHGIAGHYMTVASSNPEMLAERFDETNKDTLKFNPDAYESLKLNYIKKHSGKLRPKEGHYGLDEDSQEGKDYIQDLNWCLDFALTNREEMISRVIDAIAETTGEDLYYSCWDNALINKNHNHAIKDADGYWIHRKGATQAEEGMMGVIPGNMRDGSFIVQGLGNPDSLMSSSHGAGRVLSRKKATATLSLAEFETVMRDVKAKVGESTLDESPFAYKNIFDVMKLQKDLVETLHHIKPLINIKG